MHRWHHSLRSRLQLWNALILLLVILGFGSLLRWQMHRLQWEHVETELLACARILEGSLRGVSKALIESLSQDLGFPPGPLKPPPRPADGKRRPPPRPPMDQTPKLHVPPDNSQSRKPNETSIDWQNIQEPDLDAQTEEKWESSLRLPKSFPTPGGRTEEAAYFVIWREDTTILSESSNAPQVKPNRIEVNDIRFLRERYVIQQRNQYREVFVRGPRDTMICVGRDVIEEERRAQRRDLVLFLSGGGVFLLGLIGSWWLSRSATKPIELMATTAAAIGPRTLQKRMDLSHVGTELAQLGTVLNSMLERLDVSFRQQQQFTADASHELRTPLTVMLTATELALSRERSPDEYRENLEVCQRSAIRMRQLVESLLFLARLDSQPESIEKQSCELKKIVNETVLQLQILAEKRNVSLTTDLESATILGDALQLARLVTNLVQNAIDYNRPGGSVRIELKHSENRIELRVIDTGIGIASSDVPKLFDRFYRVDQARSRQIGGTGLGLAICRSIVEAHHGTIDVESTLGEGTTFVVRF